MHSIDRFGFASARRLASVQVHVPCSSPRAPGGAAEKKQWQFFYKSTTRARPANLMQNLGEIIKCAPAESQSHGGDVRIARKGRSLVVDIHCHLSIPAAEELMRPHMAGRASFDTFSSPSTQEVNRQQFQAIGRKLNVIDERIAEMDVLGVDIQAISPVPPQMYYAVEPDLGRQAARIVNDGIATAVARHPERLVGMGTVPLQAPELAVIEMQRCVNDLGLRGIEISSNVAG